MQKIFPLWYDLPENRGDDEYEVVAGIITKDVLVRDGVDAYETRKKGADEYIKTVKYKMNVHVDTCRCIIHDTKYLTVI